MTNLDPGDVSQPAWPATGRTDILRGDSDAHSRTDYAGDYE
jgi:hypothetical protein